MDKKASTAKNHTARVAESFGARASDYVASAVHAHGPDLEFLRSLLREQTRKAMLDIGCGGGHVSYLAAGLGHAVTAYDVSGDMLEAVRRTARQRGMSGIETRQGEAESLPFADASFPLVASRYSAHHWRDFALALREAFRVLEPGGLAVFMDVIAPGLPLLDTHLQCVELLRDTSHVRDYSAGEWLSALGGAGFAVREVRSFRLRLEFASWTERMGTPEPFRTAIRGLQEGAASDVRGYFAIEQDGSFSVDTLTIAAGKPCV